VTLWDYFDKNDAGLAFFILTMFTLYGFCKIIMRAADD